LKKVFTLQFPTFPLFTLNPDDIEDRLRRKPGLIEAFALMLPIVLTLGFVYLNAQRGMPFAPDFDIYMNATRGDFVGFYYAYWSLPIFQGLALLPGAHTAYIVWCIVNVLGVWFAARVFNGSASLALLSYQTLFVCFYGQITGVTVGALALLWWSLVRGRWLLAGIGMALALIKWQMGIPICLTLLLIANVSWRDRLRVLVVVVVIGVLSLIAYPIWIIDVIQRALTEPPIEFGDIALWQFIGVFSLLLWLPPILLPLPPGRRLVAICAASALALPYYQQSGLLTLFVLPVGWYALLGNVPFVYFWFRNTQLEWVAIVPLIAYVWTILPSLRAWITARWAQPQAATG
jgi:hypothetical protein